MGFAPPLGKVVGKVPSLLFDIELVEGDTEQEENAKPSRSTEALCQLRRCTRPRSHFVQQLDVDVRAAHEAGATEPMALADALAQKGYTMKVRRTLGSVTALRCLQNLRHTFLSCTCEGHDRPVIVDPHFREQFEVAKASPEYDSIVAELPAVFVGMEDEIELLVHLLCSELQRAFKEKGLPPWRSAASMLSKWKPLNSIDIPPTRSARSASPTADQDGSLTVSNSSSPPPGVTPSTGTGTSGTMHSNTTQIDSLRPSKPASAPGADASDGQKRLQSCSLPRVQLYGFAPPSRKVFPCET